MAGNNEEPAHLLGEPLMLPLAAAPVPLPFDVRQALRLAHCAAAAYRRTADEIAAEISAASLQVFSLGAVFGYIARLDGDTVLAFRGTSRPGEEWDRAVVQWLTNLNFSQVAVKERRIHAGFVEAVDLVWEHLHGPIRQAAATGSRLWLTGHSLGGALATLAAARLLAESICPTAVYTFGAPRVGDEAFAHAYQPVLHRVENGNDIVCHVPPPRGVMKALHPLVAGAMAGKLNWTVPTNVSYTHVGRLTFIDWDGKIWPDLGPDEQVGWDGPRLARLMFSAAVNRSSLVQDHAVGRYVERLAGALVAGRL
jgi:hypothetical protein